MIYPCWGLLHPKLEAAGETPLYRKAWNDNWEYLREVYPTRLNTLKLPGKLRTYLADLNEQAFINHFFTIATIMGQLVTETHFDIHFGILG